ncbi:MAG: GNAT family N-acetyltransferase [Planctomycetota bacterium]|nr:GNAT family N-acetyltransferase [Planctomycetota bacterium]
MHPEQFSILRRHFRAIKPKRITIARDVVRGLANEHPAFARWAKKRWTTVDDLNALIRAGVYRVSDYPQFERLCLRWGKRLASLGVPHAALIEFRTRWLAQLNAADPEMWSPETAAAWGEFLDAAIGIMARPILSRAAEPPRAKTSASRAPAKAKAESSPATEGTPIFEQRSSCKHALLIREATAEDLGGIFAIYDHEVLHGTCTFDTTPKTADERLDWLAAHLSARHPAFVAIDPARPSDVLGWASLSPWSTRCAYARAAENSVYVKESARGMGVGVALMRRLIDSAKAAGLGVILARVVEGNPASLRLHERCGFKTVGVMHRVGEKFGRILDVRLMELHVDSPGFSG